MGALEPIMYVSIIISLDLTLHIEWSWLLILYIVQKPLSNVLSKPVLFFLFCAGYF